MSDVTLRLVLPLLVCKKAKEFFKGLFWERLFPENFWLLSFSRLVRFVARQSKIVVQMVVVHAVFTMSLDSEAIALAAVELL